MSKQKLMYSILKEIEKGNRPSQLDYDITKDEFGEIIELLLDEGMLKNASVIRGGIGNKVQGVLLNGSRIGMPGLNFLEEKSNWSKAYNVLKEIRDWIK
jgi:hypothetical protein